MAENNPNPQSQSKSSKSGDAKISSLPSQVNLQEVAKSIVAIQNMSSTVISATSNLVKEATKISKGLIRRANDTLAIAYKGAGKLFEQTYLLSLELIKYRRIPSETGDLDTLSKDVLNISKQITNLSNKTLLMFATMTSGDEALAISNIQSLRKNMTRLEIELRGLLSQIKDFSVSPGVLKDIDEWCSMVRSMSDSLTKSVDDEKKTPKLELGKVILAITELTGMVVKPIQESAKMSISPKDILMYRIRMKLTLVTLGDMLRYTYRVLSDPRVDMEVLKEGVLGGEKKKSTLGALVELLDLPNKIFSKDYNVGLIRMFVIKYKIKVFMKNMFSLMDYTNDLMRKQTTKVNETSTITNNLLGTSNSMALATLEQVEKFETTTTTSTSCVTESMSKLVLITTELGKISKNLLKLLPLTLGVTRYVIYSAFETLLGTPTNKRLKYPGLIRYIYELQLQLAYLTDLRKTQIETLRVNKVLQAIVACELTLVAAGALAAPAALGFEVLLLVSIGVHKMISLLGSKHLRRLLRMGERNLKDISVCILLLSSSVTLLALTGMLITMGIDEIGVTFLMLGAIVSTFITLALASKWIRAGEKVLVAMGLCIALLSLSVLLLVETGELIQSNGDNLLKVSGLLAVTIGTALILGMMKSKVAQGVLSMLAIGLGVVLLSVAVAILAATSLIVSSNWDSIAKVGLLLLGVAELALVLGKMVSSIAVGVSSLILLSTSIIIMSVGVGLLVGAAKLAESVKWESFGKIGAILGVAVGVIIGLGVPPVAALVGLGSVVLLGLSASIAVLCGALNYMIYTAKRIEKTSIDTKKVKASVKGLFDVFIGKGGVLEQLKSFKLFPWHVARMIKLSMIASRIGRIARIVTNIANLRMVDEVDDKGNPTKTHNMTSADFTNAALNGVAVTQIFAALMGDKPTTIKLASGSVVVNPIDEKTMKRITLKSTIKFRMLSRIVKSIGNMASTVADVASLKIPIEWNKEGKPIAFRKLDDSDFKSASTRITELMTFFVRATADSATVLENVKKRNLKKIQVALSAITPVTGMVDSIKTLAEGTIPIYKKDKSGNIIVDKDGNPLIASYTTLVDWLPKASTKIKSNITSIVDTMLSAVASIMTDDRKSQLKQLKKFNKNYGESLQDMIDIINSISATDAQATAFNRNVNSSLNLLTKVSTIDINKLKYAKDLFAQIAAVAKQVNGNFDKLADVINEKLIKTLEDLSKAMDGINTSAPQRAVTNALPSNNKAKDPTIKNGKNTGASAEMSIAIQKNLEDIKNQLHLLSSVITTKGAQRALRIIE